MPRLSVSVVVPVFNGARFFARAIASARRQRYAPLEIVIVDDGSTDETPELAARLGADVRYVRQANAGPAAARNHGLRIASGDAIAFLDVDDTWAEHKLALQAGHLHDHPSIQIVQGTIRDARADGSVLAPYFNVNLGAFLFRRSVFDVIGGFDETLRMGEDADLLIRAWEYGVAKTAMRDVALIYHLHADNMTHGVDRRLFFPALLRRRLERSRAARAGSSQPQSLAEYIGWDERAEP